MCSFAVKNEIIPLSLVSTCSLLGVVAIAPQQSQTISNKEKQKKMFIIVRCCSSLLKPKADVQEVASLDNPKQYRTRRNKENVYDCSFLFEFVEAEG